LPAVAATSLLRTWLPVVVWAAVIFALSSIPSLSSGLGTWDLVLRKLAHMMEFAILGALLARALRGAPAAVLAGIAYAATDEWHQSFVRGRDGNVADVAIDAVGIIAGVIAWRRWEARTAGRATRYGSV
jgi:VanZ family protein